MPRYRPRLADDLVGQALTTVGAVIVQGPRAVGKTTSGLELASSSVRLDASADLVTLAEVSATTVLDGPVPRLIDEWQLAPSLWDAVRRDGRWAAFEVKLGGVEPVERAAASLAKLKAKVSTARAAQLGSLNVVTAGNQSYRRSDRTNVIALGHLFAG